MTAIAVGFISGTHVDASIVDLSDLRWLAIMTGLDHQRAAKASPGVV